MSYTIAVPRENALSRHATLVAFLGALAWFATLAWMRPLALPDEGRYVGVAWEMFRTGNWVTPTLDGLPFFHKPPLFYWAAAAAMHLFGPSEWAVRAAPMLAGAATVAVLFDVCREWVDAAFAKMAALVLATQPLFFGGAQFANMDLLVAGCISVAILLGARAAWRFEAGQDRRSDLAGAFVAAALGVLAKGLIGLVLPGLVLLAWLALGRRWRTIQALLWLPGLAIFAVGVVPWFVAVEWAHPGFLHYFFVVQQFQRYSGGGFNNVQPIWFYVPVLLVFTLPWSPWLLTYLRQHANTRFARPGILSLMCTWLAVVVGFFSMPASKPVGYALPALAPLAVLIALAAAPLLLRSVRARTAWRVSAGVAAVICIAVTVGFAVARPKSSQSLAAAMVSARAADEGLAFIDEYRYDVPFYLRMSRPAYVVANWDPLEVRKDDNWRKELFDAAGFAPGAGKDRLLSPYGFNAAVCGGRIKWVMAKLDSVKSNPLLGAARQVAVENDGALWSIDVSNPVVAAAAGCASPTEGAGSVQ